MAAIKAYTDLSQSKTLSKILPLESADMYYALSDDEIINMISFGKPQGFFDKTQVAWSLAALLGVIPCSYKVYRHPYDDGLSLSLQIPDSMEVAADNEVDACYEMILGLHELKML